MIVFCSAEGAVTKVLPSPVYQGSSLSGGLYFVAPFPSSNVVTVAFQLANGDFTADYPLSPITENDNELQDVFDKLGKNYSVWEWQTDNGFVTAYAGEVTAQFKVVYVKNGVAQLQTTASVVFTVQKGVETLPAAPPSDKQWDDLLALYTQLAADYTQLTADLKALGAPSIEPIAGTVPLRDKNGNVKTNEPQADNDAANKKFVGKKIAELSGEKSNATNLENGSAAYSLRQKYSNYSAKANGLNSVAFGGKRYDKLDDTSRTPTSAEGNQSFAAGGSAHAYGDFSAAMGKDTAAYQKCSFVAGGGNMAGNPEGDPDSYSFAVVFGENNKATGRSSFAAGANNKVSGLYSAALGDNNNIESGSSFAVGDDHISKGQGNTLLGQGNAATGTYGTATGRQNKLSGESNFVAGKKNEVTSAYEGTAFGYGNKVSGDYSFAANIGNVVSHSVATVFGRYNKSSSNDQTVLGKYCLDNGNAALIVGNGFSDYRQNAFEVLWDGRAKVYGAPKDDNDVVRLKDLTEKRVRLYRHRIDINKMTDNGPHSIVVILYATHNTAITINNFSDIGTLFGFLPLDYSLFIPAYQYKTGKCGLCAITFGFIVDNERVLMQVYNYGNSDSDQYVIVNGDTTYTITDIITEV